MMETYCGISGLNPHPSTVPIFPCSDWVAGSARVGETGEERHQRNKTIDPFGLPLVLALSVPEPVMHESVCA